MCNCVKMKYIIHKLEANANSRPIIKYIMRAVNVRFSRKQKNDNKNTWECCKDAGGNTSQT